MQIELIQSSPLLNPSGSLVQVGWARQPIFDCNLEKARFYKLRFLQKYRIKRWDYYAIFGPNSFFSATIADLGYAGNIFVYYIDFTKHDLHEEGLIVPFGRNIELPRNSVEGNSYFENRQVKLEFEVKGNSRYLSISWPGFHNGRGISADIRLKCLLAYESMNIVIPIQGNRFYLNRKINCLPAEGTVKYGDQVQDYDPSVSLGSLDWGRGVWEYKSFWNWASASVILPDNRNFGLNLGCGFGDLSNAGENAIIIENQIHKLGSVRFDYQSGDYMQSWKFYDNEGRLDLIFTPFRDRIAKTNLGVISSEVHQVFGRYNGTVVSDSGERIKLHNLIGFAEEHHAKW